MNKVDPAPTTGAAAPTTTTTAASTTPATGTAAATPTAGTIAGSNVTAIPSRVTEAPYNLTACNQVIEIAGKTLNNLDDYASRGDGFFTMSIYLVNQFAKKDSSTLQKSIYIDRIKESPSIYHGSVSCIRFYDGNTEIPMCMSDYATAMNVIDSYNKFLKCRMGDNLKISNDASIITKILSSSCLGMDIKLNATQYGNNTVQLEAALKEAISTAVKNTLSIGNNSTATTPVVAK